MTVLSELVSAVDRLKSMDPAESPVVLSVRSERTGPRRRVTDRIGETELSNLINAYSAGTPAWKLAAQYAISERTIRRMARERGVRLRAAPAV